ncbi:hypothetical protein ERO13_A05G263900v2 [Gossypium hirsutum]|uniref:Ribosomal protein L13 n=1 Tax=Gossypium mustelinum TaxID=34275 RepID=A0A5D2ZER0_GOSMU|nr:hypothetical protein ERO13_A05G263900v2 [Gossypium hirsutum]TYJ36059.1 hypothetical protein E1A91_A05G281900v1 [Gossypium mustelinum]KAG4201208.1 hypothetical protein ERO13_A05G263900v2 [Gossypium hirsutum]TYJ36060.1 hypothetical protein E1A91_A05G281900v1 [Gossypium mustelinum]TYJ36061.1 hypothetical protein E1A91_A05G281900v1 [Gossypium mustelinum]
MGKQSHYFRKMSYHFYFGKTFLGKEATRSSLPLPLPPSFLDIWNNTWYPKAKYNKNTEKKTWYIVDATDKILGRLASTIAVHIRGKNLATYTPSVDLGAFVIVVNAEKSCCIWKEKDTKSSTGGIQED